VGNYYPAPLHESNSDPDDTLAGGSAMSENLILRHGSINHGIFNVSL